MDKAEKVADQVAGAGMGQKPVEMSHPIHPATVHWPIAFLTASFTLDTLQTFAPGVFAANGSSAGKGVLATVIPRASMISPMAHYANAAGILFATVSISTGLSELYGMWKGQAQQKGGWLPALKDAYTGDKNDVAAHKLKTTISHASMNDMVVGVAAYNFYKRATNANLALPRFNGYLSAAVLPLLMYSAYLGGALVYEMGVGVMRQGEGLEYKKLQEKQQ